jgi:predicted transcriptional regulator of viral defense system
MKSDSNSRARALFEKHGGTLRTCQAIGLGIHPRTLYQMRDAGKIVQVSRGIFRLNSLPQLGHPDLVTIAIRIPKAVVCLVSALAYHDITSEIPHEVHIALPRGTKTPRLSHPPIRVYRLSGPPLTEGIQDVFIDGVRVRMYCPEKSVADCFRFRKKLGIDVAVEALRFSIERKGSKQADILHYARLCRVEKVMQPYLETLQ